MAITKITPVMTTFGEASDAALALINNATGDPSTGILTIGGIDETTFAGSAGLALIVNPAMDGLIFAALAGGGPATFVGLTDGPGAFTNAFDVLEINATGDGLQYRPPAPPGKCFFWELDDTPTESEMIGSVGQYLTVAEGGGLTSIQLPPSGSTTFVGLFDTPETFGVQGQILQIGSSNNTLEWVNNEPYVLPDISFVSLIDTPAVVVPGQFLRGNPNGNGELQFTPGTWPTTFLGLSDTPVNFAGAGGRTVRVRADMLGIEFVNDPAIPTSLLTLADTPSTWGTVNYLLQSDGAGACTWVAPAAGGVVNHIDLADTPAGYGTVGDQLVSSGSGLVWEAQPTIPTHLVNLLDFPAILGGPSNGGKLLALNALGDAVEFIENTGGGTPTVTSLPAPIMVAISDETTVFGTGTDVITFRAPYAFTLSEVKASLTTASTLNPITIDVKMGGFTIFGTQLTIDVNEKTTKTAAAAATLVTTAIPDDAEFTVTIVGAGTGAVGLKLSLIPA
jgi:hypothetical protein